MAKTRAQLRTSVEALVGRTDKTSVIDDALNFALQEAADQHYFSELWSQSDESIVQAANSVAFKAGSRDLLEARLIDSTNSSSWVILIVPKFQFVSSIPSIGDVDEGRPSVGYIEGETLHFAPPSDGTYVIRMTTITVPTFSSDSDTSSIKGIDEFLISYAAEYLFASIELPESAMLWSNKWKVVLSRAIRADKKNPSVQLIMQPHGSDNKLRYISGNPAQDPFVRMIK